ncbi:MAG: FKBP-type peptidyl-prolyl cis-trans isomerase [Candidatus Kariarchaeaceae archaeon]|jgi:FKBP-type peptidyl-prolyl cis-trans isomerase 2
MLETGSMIKIDYTAKIMDTDPEKGGTRVFDTTIEEVAREQSIYKPDKVYEPMLVVLGRNWIPKGLEKRILEASVGDSFETNIPSEEAYGPKDPSKIKLVARREFQKLNINPSVGDRITIGSQTGTVLSVTSGRVRMDYNHVLAGMDIDYDIVVHEKIDGEANFIKELIRRRLPGANLEGLDIIIEGDKIIVDIPEHARFFEYVQFAKAEVSKDIGEIVPGFEKIEFRELFDIPKPL